MVWQVYLSRAIINFITFEVNAFHHKSIKNRLIAGSKSGDRKNTNVNFKKSLIFVNLNSEAKYRRRFRCDAWISKHTWSKINWNINEYNLQDNVSWLQNTILFYGKIEARTIFPLPSESRKKSVHFRAKALNLKF